MKRHITFITIVVLCGIPVLGSALDNHSSYNDPEAPTFQDSHPAIIHQDQTVGNQECWFVEGGVEWLYMTSTITPTFSDEFYLITQLNPPGFNFSLNDRITKSIEPDYNSGFAAHLKFRPLTNNDMGLYYKYVRSNGDGRINRDVTSPRPLGGSDRNIQDDKGSLHSHLHVVDFMFGRTFCLTPRFTLRLAGGLCYNDFHLSIRFDDNDQLIQRNAAGVITSDTINILEAESKNSLWGLGPKIETDFEYYFLPKTWNHDLNFFLETQFSLLYTKEWSKGRILTLNINQTPPPPDVTNGNVVNWNNHPKFEFLPNINLDMGIKYNCNALNGVIIKFAAGYRVLAYWNLEEFSRLRTFQGGEDIIFFFNSLEDHFAYSGPYVNFSLAY